MRFRRVIAAAVHLSPSCIIIDKPPPSVLGGAINLSNQLLPPLTRHHICWVVVQVIVYLSVGHPTLDFRNSRKK